MAAAEPENPVVEEPQDEVKNSSFLVIDNEGVHINPDPVQDLVNQNVNISIEPVNASN